MKSQNLDYEAVLLDLEDKRRAMNKRFDAAIAAIRQVLVLERGDRQPPLPSPRINPRPNSVGPSLGGNQHGPYQGRSLVDAALAYLEKSGGGPIPNVALARALEAGGLEHKSKSFPNTLNSVLRRYAATKGDLQKGPQGWMLTLGNDVARTQ